MTKDEIKTAIALIQQMKSEMVKQLPEYKSVDGMSGEDLPAIIAGMNASLAALSTALIYLREALKRAEGCPACRGNKPMYGHPGAFPVKVDASPYGSTLDVKVPDYGGAIGFCVEISYCPNCGRRLGEKTDANGRQVKKESKDNESGRVDGVKSTYKQVSEEARDE